jgi:AGCS family alanine or glycine:cation symporter
MLVILFGGGLFMTVRLNFFQFRYLPFICRQTFGSIFKKQEGEGTISPFQAAFNFFISSWTCCWPPLSFRTSLGYA